MPIPQAITKSTVMQAINPHAHEWTDARGSGARISLQATSITPAAWHHPLWEQANGPLGTVVAGSISLDPFETRSALARLLAYAGIFWLSLQYCRSAERAGEVFLALTIAGLAYATYGLAVEFTGGNMALWYYTRPYPERLGSTFINDNPWNRRGRLDLPGPI